MNREQEINDYIHGKLDVKSKMQFELELKENTELKFELNEILNVFEGIKNSEKQELKLRLQKLSNNDNTSVKTPHKKAIQLKTRYLLMAAASIIPLVFLINSYFFSGNTTENDLYNNYFTTYPNTLQPIERDHKNLNVTKKAFIAYESDNFNTASRLFKAILKTNNDPDLRFYYAMSLLNNGKNDKALTVLNTLKKANGLYTAQTYWYAALIELKNGNKGNAIQLMDALILLNSGYKHTQALELREQLKK